MMLLFLGLIGCTGVQQEKTVSKKIEPKPVIDTARPEEEPLVEIEVPHFDGEGLLLSIQDREMLSALERHFSFGSVLADRTELIEDRISNASLYKSNPQYQQFVDMIAPRIDEINGSLGVPLVVELADALAYPAGNVGRRFDVRWLRSQEGFFSLVGVVNRIDRMDFDEGCGSIRLIYRLGYQTKEGKGSHLPFTMNVVLKEPQGDCQKRAHAWILDETNDVSEKVQQLSQDALQRDRLQLHQLEINAQITRFPSGLETEFGGQALYLLKVLGFQATSDGMMLYEKGLENTPDVLAIQKNPEKKQALLQYIVKNLEAIDLGVYQIPETFLAKEVLSYSTLGINRSANKPFDHIFSSADWETVELPAQKHWISSTEGLLERLNNGTCVGCHQTGSTAGFHFVGRDDHTISGITNRIQLPFSEFFHKEQMRREQYLIDLINRQDPERFRPHALMPLEREAQRNSMCILDEHRDSITSPWGCAEGLSCEKIVEDPLSSFTFGVCVAPQADLQTGDLCREGSITPEQREAKLLYNQYAVHDRFAQKQRHSLSEKKKFFVDQHNCRPPRIGVPLGRVFRRCSQTERTLTTLIQEDGRIDPEICAVVGGSKFDTCVEKDFHSCLQSIVGRGMVDSCHLGDFCREDYICQQLPYQLAGLPTEEAKAAVERGVGFCTPTYFLFQLRLDGHPVPKR